MINLGIRVDMSGAFKMLNGLKQGMQDKITQQSLNRMAERVKTDATNRIYKEFNLPRFKVADRIKVRRASIRLGVFQAEVSVPMAGGRFRALHITDLKGTKDLHNSLSKVGKYTARMARRDRKGKVTSKGGVEYSILRGQKKVKPHAFIAPGKNSGKLIAFERENQNDPHSKLKAVYVVDVPQMFNASRVKMELVRLIERELPKEIERRMGVELARVSR